ncbi:hypothetical protein CVT24_012550 [Panaeolus cyanescens]|uniref:Uncharacterized protein n=1 Tax=Panaeolus cyanescens TaxID=181874 RepID=A0A409W634_9AGAR|nr:hypothetical protein CVT24_012550 [Panaeolus cyanescens]
MAKHIRNQYCPISVALRPAQGYELKRTVQIDVLLTGPGLHCLTLHYTLPCNETDYYSSQMLLTIMGYFVRDVTKVDFKSVVAIDKTFLDFLSAKDLMKLAKVSHTLRYAVLNHCRSTYQIEDDLTEFFEQTEVPAFRAMQEETGLIISGSFALRFVSRQHFGPDSDLDLYVEDVHAIRVLQWLTGVGYATASLPDNLHNQYTHRPSMTRRRVAKIRAVFTLFRHGKKVQVMVTRHSTVSVVLEFHSTCVMNIITHNRAYCLYPRATLEENRSFVLKHPEIQERRSEGAIQKYRRRGFAMQYGLDSELDFSRRSSPFFVGRRYVGDSLCWVIDLRGDMGWSMPDRGYIEGNAWEALMSSSSPGRVRHTFITLQRYGLKYRYTLDRQSHRRTCYKLRAISYSELDERWALVLCFKLLDTAY